MPSIRVWLFALVALCAACGAKTQLEDYEFDLDGAVVECFRDIECDDGIDCTIGRCRRGTCFFEGVDELCALDLQCLVGRCEPLLGCTGDAVTCNDRVPCTIDVCGEPDGCQYIPDDTRCPVSYRCDVERNCVAQALVHDEDMLYQVDLPTGDWSPLVEIRSFTDIALGPDRTLYACDTEQLYTFDIPTGRVTSLGPAPSSLVALEVGPDGALYGAALDDLVTRTDLVTGLSEVYGRMPAGWVAAGDIAFVEGRMLITVTDTPSGTTARNQLAEIFADGTSRLLGPIGVSCLWGVAAFGSELYAFSCRGELLRVDPFTGESEELRVIDIRVRGAAAR